MRQPNILHLFTDQQRVDSICSLGHPFLQTPHLDWLARTGTAFTSAYTPVAECVPARACMITGMYADKTGCGSNADNMPPEDHPTLMSLLAGAGYRTHGVGKCHFTPNPWAMRGFHSRDTMEEIPEHPEGDDFLSSVRAAGFGHVLEPHGVRGEMYYVPQPSQLPAEHHPVQWVGDRCLDFLKKQSRLKSPFYLYAGLIHPHPPFTPPNPWHKLYRAPDMPLPYLPDNASELTCFINRFQNRYKYRDRGLDLNLIRCIRAYYYACVSFIDYQVGRLLKQLETMGELDNTLIVFSADHGELLGDFGCFGKRSFHDASQRVPLLARQPGRFKKGGRCDVAASLVDLLPTFLSVAEASVPPECDGVDLARLTKRQPLRKGVLFHYNRGANAILGMVTDRWKYAWSAPDQKDYLFDRSERPEKRNQVESAAGASVAKKLGDTVRQRAGRHPFSCTALNRQGGWKRFALKRMPKDLDAGLLYQDPAGNPQMPDPYQLDYPKHGFPGF